MEFLEEVLLRLQAPDTDDALSASDEVIQDRVRLAKTSTGRPAFVLEHSSTVLGFGIELKNVEYETAGQYVLDGRDVTLAVLRCCGGTTELERYFLRVVSGCLAELPLRPSASQFDSWVRRLVGVFEDLDAAGTRSVQGLWAELLTILNAPDPTYALQCWHVDPDDTFDFAAPPDRVEVKSTTRQERVHRFSLEQLDSAVGGTTIVTSYCLRRDTNGDSIVDLVDELSSSLPPADVPRLHRTVAKALGDQWREASQARFSRAGADASIRKYSALSVPTVVASSRVANVKFDADLTEIDALQCPPDSPLFAALFAVTGTGSS